MNNIELTPFVEVEAITGKKDFSYSVGKNYPEPYGVHWKQKYTLDSNIGYVYGILEPEYVKKREIWFIVWDLLVSEGLAPTLLEKDKNIMEKIHNVLMGKEEYVTALWLDKLNNKNKW